MNFRNAVRRRRGSRRGMTMVQVVIIIAVVVVLLLVGCVVFMGMAMARGPARQLKDSAQVRDIMQGLALWAGNNEDQYPLPSAMDPVNATVPELGEAKNTTSNIFSILIHQGVFPTSLLVSPAEVNKNIQVMKGYGFRQPKKAVDPQKACWDPAFSADFTSGQTSNLSYAHLMPAGERLKLWRYDLSASALLPVLGNRGPKISSVTKKAGPGVSYTLANPASNTLRIHGSRTHWEGNVGYNDNHVNFETTMFVSQGGDPRTHYKDAVGAAWQDVLFYDEPDDAEGTNAFLGVFTKAGKTKADFKAIWD